MRDSYPWTQDMLIQAVKEPAAFMASQILPILKPGKPVRHQQTCPVCGRTLVNTYLREGEWKCKKCWDLEGSEADGQN